MKRRSPGASRSGYIWKVVTRCLERLHSKSLSALERSVADGIATALCPAESIAQLSEQPSVMYSSSSGRNMAMTGRAPSTTRFVW